MLGFLLTNKFLLAMAALEFSQAVSDAGANWPRAIIMLLAAAGSVTLIWVD